MMPSVDVPEQANGPDPSRMRASDADRDRVADQLREALAEGRLTPEEHSERIEALYQAKTYAELVPIVEDLPATGGGVGPQVTPATAERDLPAPAPTSSNITAIFAGAVRKGRWLVEPQTNAVSVFGGVELDLCGAVLSQREVTINVVAIMGSVHVVVPPGVRVVNNVNAVLGNASTPEDQGVGPDAPVLRLTGIALFGDASVTRRENKKGLIRGRDRRERRDRRRSR